MSIFWTSLLYLKNQVATFDAPIRCFSLQVAPEPSLSFNRFLSPTTMDSKQSVLLHFEIDWQKGFLKGIQLTKTSKKAKIHLQEIFPEYQQFFQLYLPYCLISNLAQQQQRTISISHFAQSLDGKIATHTGDSQWIGNPENLLHAHRMRALCDGILIGKNTLQNDAPSLTVRHVEGKNPKRIVISSSACDYSSLLKNETERILVLGKNAISPSHQHPSMDYIQLPCTDGRIDTKLILEELFRQGIYSVYIEGGAQTTSTFLKEGNIDVLQLHLSPQVFGSGISGISLPTIDRVQDSIAFKHTHFYRIGNAVMFVGEMD
ncbi:MAG: RibD family protein [Chitinophagales bacterium]